MKKTVSLLLVLFMIVSLLPIATIFASADEPYHYSVDFTTLTPLDGRPAAGESSSNITSGLPTGWIATTDTDGTWWTAINYDNSSGSDVQMNNGVRLGGDGQGIAMTDAAGVPDKIRNATSDYYLQLKWNTKHKFAIIRFGWQEAVPTASSVAVGTHVAYDYTGGPSNNGAFSNGAGKGGVIVYNGSYATNFQDLEGKTLAYQDIVNRHSAGAAAGHTVTTTFEIVGGKLVAVYNTIDAETVKFLPSADFTAVKGYFSVWITNWAANNTASIQKVDIQEGAFDPQSLAPAPDEPDDPEDPDTPFNYYIDFTKLPPDAGTTGTINGTLPEAWVSKPDPDIVTKYDAEGRKFSTITTAINYEADKTAQGDVQVNNGVRFGGADQGIAMTDKAGIPSRILKATTDYTVTVKWNTTYKFAWIRFGWSGKGEDGKIAVPTGSTVIAGTNIGFNYTGGPHNLGGVQEAFGDFVQKKVDGGNFTFNGVGSGSITDEYGRELDLQGVYDLYADGVKHGHQATTTIQISGGKVVAVYNTIDGITAKYTPATDFIPLGYFSVWISNWGNNNAASVQSVEIKEGAYTASEFATVSGVTPVSAVDFANIKSDEDLAAAGYGFYAEKPADSGDYQPKVTYVANGVALNAASDEYFVNTAAKIESRGNYIVDYTFRLNPAVTSFYTALGLAGDSISQETLKAQWATVSANSAFLFGAEGFKFYADETFETELAETPSIAIDNTVPVRVRILVSGGSAEYVFLSVGNEHYYLKKTARVTSAAGLVGFTFGEAYNAGHGIVLEKCVISSCDMGDTSGGDLIVPDKEIDYTDAAETYYKDGYVLHNMDFSKVGDYYDTAYSFASNSSTDRVVKVEDGVLVFSNNGSKAAYLMFTGNAIPKNITEYTATFKFRFVGAENSYFGFLRGISLNEDGSRKSSQSIEISYKGEKIYDATPADDAVWGEIVTAMKAGEWLEVTVSNINRYVDAVVVKCGEKSVSFNMDKNKEADAGYMGFIIGANANVEVASVTILAGLAENATTPIWPEGVTAGDLVQNVTVAAVAEGTKPDYSNRTPSSETETTGGDNTEPATAPVTTAPATTEETTPAKKGCKSSLVALPALLATAIFGCAVTVCRKKKED